jgi:hypothetical protein
VLAAPDEKQRWRRWSTAWCETSSADAGAALEGGDTDSASAQV